MSKNNSNHQYSLQDILGTTVPKGEALRSIQNDPEAFTIFEALSTEDQNRILSFMQGNQGLQIMHDKFSQKILNPATHPERLESLMSAILGTKVKIKQIFPRDGEQLGESGSLVVMDFVVELLDGSFVNVEIQQVGYEFPGERANCYSADLTMRQYNLLRSRARCRNKTFHFRDMNPVVVIIFMKKSSSIFSEVSPQYIHRKETSYSSGARVRELSKIIYVSLDTFHNIVQNIHTELDAWLTFLGSDDPAHIVKLVNAYPEFCAYYQDIVEFRRKPKELLSMYSEVLAMMDHNTELYMIDEMKKEIEVCKAELTELNSEIEKQRKTLAERDSMLAERDSALAEKDSALAEKDSALSKRDTEIEALKAQLVELKRQINN